MRLAILLLCIPLSGCLNWWYEDTPIPEKATTDGLSHAERELDAAVDTRLSKIGASIKVSSDLLWGELDEDSDPALKAVQAELEIAQLLAGVPRVSDETEALDRLSKAVDGDATLAYANAKKEVEKLNSIIKMADIRYESEKAKKEAAYNAQIQAKEMELKAAEEARINDRFLVAGGVLLLAGALLLALTPAKALGAILAIHGLVIGAIPLVRNEPWFKFAVGGVLGLFLLAMFYFLSKFFRKKPDVDEPSAE